MKHILETPVEYLKGVGPARAEILRKEANISTFGDLLLYYPFRYVDRSRFFTIAEIESEAAWIQLKGRITAQQLFGKGHSARIVYTFKDIS